MAGGMHSRGACMAGGMHGGGHAWHTVNERAVHILLECILIWPNFHRKLHENERKKLDRRSYFFVTIFCSTVQLYEVICY